MTPNMLNSYRQWYARRLESMFWPVQTEKGWISSGDPLGVHEKAFFSKFSPEDAAAIRSGLARGYGKKANKISTKEIVQLLNQVNKADAIAILRQHMHEGKL